MSRPLDGIRVVALEQAVAGPLCTRHLADLGADVVKIERPEGDFARRYDSVVLGQSAYFVWLNRGKRSLTLDLTQAADRAALERLLERADVLVHNLGPGSLERLGLGWEALHARWPRLVSVGISGYGPDGPYRDRKAYDLLLQAESGVMSVTGTPEQPAKVGISIGDIGAGMYALASTLAALRQRDADGQGRRVEVSILDCLAEWMMAPAYHQMYAGAAPPRAGMRHNMIVPYGPYRCADGQVTLAIQNEGQWARFCEIVLGRPELAADDRFATNERRVRDRAELEAVVEEVLAGQTTAEVERALAAADVPFGSFNTVADLVAHPQLAARGRWVEVETPGGPVRALVPPFGIDDLAMGAVPGLGEHSAAVRGELER
ncbi:MAG: CaiB/BaiF CoA transferase family protein [Candidatus Limnocylindria bacterium]